MSKVSAAISMMRPSEPSRLTATSVPCTGWMGPTAGMSGAVVDGNDAPRAADARAMRSRLPGDGAIVCAKASFGGAWPLPEPAPMTPEVAAGCATRGAGADETGGTLRGMPAGGVGVTAGVDGCGMDGCGMIVLATPIVWAPIGAAADGVADGAGTFAGPDPGAVIGCAGALRTDCGAAAPGACGVNRCPQCWQKAKPTGVPLPHAGQIALAACAVGAGAAAAAGATGDSVAATVAAEPSGAAGAFAISEVPHILQKFMPGGLTVPHALQVVAPAAAAGFGAGAASRRWPQS